MTVDNWLLSGELPRANSQALETAVEAASEELGEFPPTVSRFEQAGSELWRVDIYFAGEPASDFINKILEAARLTDWQYDLAAIEERDWVSESQKLLAPVRSGRFLVYGAHDVDKADPSLINLQVDAGQAFGTGKHETTAACLALLDQLADGKPPASYLDLGTGSGVLALAAAKIWPEARGTGSDIDPIATDVAIENASINDVQVRALHAAAGVHFLTADGFDHPTLAKETPYELIVANILAGPLIEMAADVAGALAQNGALILSGLLISQKADVLAAYAQQGLGLVAEQEDGEWAALQLAWKA